LGGAGWRRAAACRDWRRCSRDFSDKPGNWFKSARRLDHWRLSVWIPERRLVRGRVVDRVRFGLIVWGHFSGRNRRFIDRHIFVRIVLRRFFDGWFVGNIDARRYYWKHRCLGYGQHHASVLCWSG
jgi:hypothetical protein